MDAPVGTSITLAAVTQRVDEIIADCRPLILAFVNDLTAECRYVAAIFDGSDPEGMRVYADLGLEAKVSSDGMSILDVLQKPLDEALRRNRYVAIDELSGYEPGTVLVYVFTRGAAVVRRFDKGAAREQRLREVRRTRDVEIRTGVDVEGVAALDLLVRRCAPVLQGLANGNEGRVALIARASHGAKVGYVEREVAARAVRSAGTRAPSADRDWHLRTAQEIESSPPAGKLACIVEGWGPLQLLWLERRALPAAVARRRDDPHEERLREWIVACRERKRAIGLLEKSLDHLGESSPACIPLAELVALVRNTWDDCAAIQRQIPAVLEAVSPLVSKPAGERVHGIMVALAQATTERARGAVVKASGTR